MVGTYLCSQPWPTSVLRGMEASLPSVDLANSSARSLAVKPGMRSCIENRPTFTFTFTISDL